jgi:Putative transposase
MDPIRVLLVDDVFVAKGTKAGRLVPTRCQFSEFVRLLAAHVPDRYRHAIRYFGLLAPSAKGNKWAGLFVALSQKIKTPPPRLS